MTNREKKEILGQYRFNEMETDRLQEELADWENRARRMTQTWGELPSEARGEGFQACMEHVVEYRRALQERIARGIRLRRGISEAIAALPDARLRQLMHLHFIQGLTIADTAEQMSYSARQVDNLLVRALHRLELQNIA